MTTRLTILLAVLLAGMSSVFLLPKGSSDQPGGIELELPKMVGGWYGTEEEVTQKEKDTLGLETAFARKRYKNGAGRELLASVVVSGSDMSKSIHRLERCLQAQGFNIADARTESLDVPGRGTLPVKRLLLSRPARDRQGNVVQLMSLGYYWFAGHTDLTASHTDRMWIDMKDRLLHGYSQRWGYVTITAPLGVDAKGQPVGVRETETRMREYIQTLAPKILKDSVKYGG